MTENEDSKFCVDCGAKIHARAEICPSCGNRQPSLTAPTGGSERYVPLADERRRTQTRKKGTSKWIWAVLIIIGLAIIGGLLPDDSSSSSGSSSSGSSSSGSSAPSITYTWTRVWYREFEPNIYDLYWDNDLETFEIPQDATELKVEITFSGGDKDSYIRIKLYRWGVEDDILEGSYYKNAKLGTGYIEETSLRGRKYFINLAAVHGLSFEIEVTVKVPE